MEKVIIYTAMNDLYIEFCMNDSKENHNESPSSFKEAERTVFYCDLGMTVEMQQKIKDVNKKGGRYDIRWLSDSEWDIFIEMCELTNISIPKRVLKV
jgi:hypothetical protein